MACLRPSGERESVGEHRTETEPVVENVRAEARFPRPVNGKTFPQTTGRQPCVANVEGAGPAD